MVRIALSLLLPMVLVVTEAAAETRTFEHTNFNEIDASTALEVNVSRADGYRVTATGTPKDLKLLVVKQDGSRLVFTLRTGQLEGSVTLDVTLPALRRFDLRDGVNGNIKMPTGSPSFASRISGGASLEGSLTSRDITLDASDGSNVELSGSVDALKINGSEGAELELKNLTATSAVITLSGGSQATVTVNGKIDIIADNGSELTYYGNATFGKRSTRGASEIQKGR